MEQMRIEDRAEGQGLRRGRVGTQCGSARGTKAQDAVIDAPTWPAAAHLVIAEDDRAMRQFLVESFEEEGYLVTEAGNGEELRRRISASGRAPGTPAPDILISDIRLPGLTGLELLAYLRESDWSLPVILITAFGDEAVHLEGKRLGVAMVLDKPFDTEILLNAVKTLVPAR